MPKPKDDKPEESKRLETTRLYAEMAGHDPDEALKEGVDAAPAPAEKPKGKGKRAKR